MVFDHQNTRLREISDRLSSSGFTVTFEVERTELGRGVASGNHPHSLTFVALDDDCYENGSDNHYYHHNHNDYHQREGRRGFEQDKLLRVVKSRIIKRSLKHCVMCVRFQFAVEILS